MINSSNQYEIMLRGNSSVPQIALFIGNGKTKEKLRSMPIENSPELSNEAVLNPVKSEEKHILDPDNMSMITPGSYVDGHIAVIETKKVGFRKKRYETRIKFTTI